MSLVSWYPFECKEKSSNIDNLFSGTRNSEADFSLKKNNNHH